VSKIANFILPVVPAVLLLVGLTGYDLYRAKEREWVFPMAWVVFPGIVLYSLNIFHLHDAVASLGNGAAPAALLAWGCLGVPVMIGVRKVRPGAMPEYLRLAFPALAACAFLSVMIQNSVNQWNISKLKPRDYDEQMALKASAERIRGWMSKTAVVFVAGGQGPNAPLYLQYWSGLNSLPGEQIGLEQMSNVRGHDVYLLTPHTLANRTPVQRVAYGYLYRMDSVDRNGNAGSR